MKQILLLTGENEVLKNDYLAKMLTNFSKDEINTIYLDQISIDELFSEFQTFDMFSKKRVFILKNFDNFSENSITHEPKLLF